MPRLDKNVKKEKKKKKGVNHETMVLLFPHINLYPNYELIGMKKCLLRVNLGQPGLMLHCCVITLLVARFVCFNAIQKVKRVGI